MYASTNKSSAEPGSGLCVGKNQLHSKQDCGLNVRCLYNIHQVTLTAHPTTGVGLSHALEENIKSNKSISGAYLEAMVVNSCKKYMSAL